MNLKTKSWKINRIEEDSLIYCWKFLFYYHIVYIGVFMYTWSVLNSLRVDMKVEAMIVDDKKIRCRYYFDHVIGVSLIEQKPFSENFKCKLMRPSIIFIFKKYLQGKFQPD